MDTSWFRYKGDGSLARGSEPPPDAEPGVYLAGEDLVIAVNTAITVEQPLLVVGESGTGKTTLAESIALELGLPLLKFHTRSDHRARDVLFVVDNLRRFYDATVQDPRAKDFENYVTWQALGSAIRQRTQCVVLIDEIDKAPRDFPNDLLNEIDRMEFRVPELDATYRAVVRPIVIVTSNNERQLPEPFLRRCVFHSISFPDEPSLRRILSERLKHLQAETNLIDAATRRFLALRDDALQLEKKPATGELITWVKVLTRAGIDPARLEATPLRELPFLGTILKNQSDLDAVRQSPA
jgi:MoxR-like ATPase